MAVASQANTGGGVLPNAQHAVSPSLLPAEPIQVPKNYIEIDGLLVHPTLYKTVQDVVVPGTGVSTAYFWNALEQLNKELRPEVLRCLQRRDELQLQIDAFYDKHRKAGINIESPDFRPMCSQMLRSIGYLEKDLGPVSVQTQHVDPEVALVAAPQLVVPSDNSRYVINAVNARWGSLFDALYGFDVIPASAFNSKSVADGEADPTVGYNPVRGEAVIEFANSLLDEIAPLALGKWREVTRLWPVYVGSQQQLELLLASGATTSLKTPSLFVGSTGNLGPPTASIEVMTSNAGPKIPDKGSIFLCHNQLHMILEIDRDHNVGKTSRSGIKDIVVESAITSILDMEDSVAAVDAEDKAKIYSNICGVLRGQLQAPFVKDGKAQTRRLNNDLWFRDAKGNAKSLPGRAVCLVRNVGHHMFTDMVVAKDGRPIPEGFVDCLVTVAASLHDLRGTCKLMNSRMGSVYIVKPKMHGSEEVALTNNIFGRVEEFFGLRRNTVKLGLMDEERRTSVNLRECIRAAVERVFFINTGFMDRTGDEIHTCMNGHAVVPKGQMRQTPWIKAYEDSNVDVGLFAGLPGKGQIGKGMWAKPDKLKSMLEDKIAEPMSGASTAWVPSPAAAALHSIHYHRVDVAARQMQLAMRKPVKQQAILLPPFMKDTPDKEVILRELKETAQSILGYVVRWIDLGVGCSKVPDLNNVGLMEDRATLRISSQLMANWLKHELITEAEIHASFEEMARVVDQQNARDKSYRPMSGNTGTNVAFQAALQLVLEGTSAPNGYTEPALHNARRKVKAESQMNVARL